MSPVSLVVPNRHVFLIYPHHLGSREVGSCRGFGYHPVQLSCSPDEETGSQKKMCSKCSGSPVRCTALDWQATMPGVPRPSPPERKCCSEEIPYRLQMQLSGSHLKTKNETGEINLASVFHPVCEIYRLPLDTHFIPGAKHMLCEILGLEGKRIRSGGSDSE